LHSSPQLPVRGGEVNITQCHCKISAFWIGCLLCLQSSYLCLLLYILSQNNKTFLSACSCISIHLPFSSLIHFGSSWQVHYGKWLQTFRQDWLTSLWILAMWHGSPSLEKYFFVSIKYKGPWLLNRPARNKPLSDCCNAVLPFTAWKHWLVEKYYTGEWIFNIILKAVTTVKRSSNFKGLLTWDKKVS
jgi:hypothetical protein